MKDEINNSSQVDFDDKLLKKFNWGAFLMSPIWFIMYKQWVLFVIVTIALIFFNHLSYYNPLLIVPYYVLTFFLGRKGTRIAWKVYGGNDGNVDIILKAQRDWIIPGIIINLLYIIYIIFGALGKALLIQNSANLGL